MLIIALFLFDLKVSKSSKVETQNLSECIDYIQIGSPLIQVNALSYCATFPAISVFL